MKPLTAHVEPIANAGDPSADLPTWDIIQQEIIAEEDEIAAQAQQCLQSTATNFPPLFFAALEELEHAAVTETESIGEAGDEVPDSVMSVGVALYQRAGHRFVALNKKNQLDYAGYLELIALYEEARQACEDAREGFYVAACLVEIAAACSQLGTRLLRAQLAAYHASQKPSARLDEAYALYDRAIACAHEVMGYLHDATFDPEADNYAQMVGPVEQLSQSLSQVLEEVEKNRLTMQSAAKKTLRRLKGRLYRLEISRTRALQRITLSVWIANPAPKNTFAQIREAVSERSESVAATLAVLDGLCNKSTLVLHQYRYLHPQNAGASVPAEDGRLDFDKRLIALQDLSRQSDFYSKLLRATGGNADNHRKLSRRLLVA